MVCKYRVRIDTVVDDEGKAVIVYGITAFDPDTMMMKDFIPDVFLIRRKLKPLSPYAIL